MICQHCKGTGIVTVSYIEGRSRDFDCTNCGGSGRIDEVSFSLTEAGVIKRCLKNFEIDFITEDLLRDECLLEANIDNVETFIARCRIIGVIE